MSLSLHWTAVGRRGNGGGRGGISGRRERKPAQIRQGFSTAVLLMSGPGGLLAVGVPCAM